MTTQTYHGKPCRVCGGTLRYRASRRCLACNAARVRPPELPYAERPRNGDPEVAARNLAHKNARWLNTYLLIYHPTELARRAFPARPAEYRE